ncbi:MAG: hypothetical protein IJF08_04015 [Clostridia bacterium]|nr:hypothetical protein [Clostridia bacterium]
MDNTPRTIRICATIFLVAGIIGFFVLGGFTMDISPGIGIATWIIGIFSTIVAYMCMCGFAALIETNQKLVKINNEMANELKVLARTYLIQNGQLNLEESYSDKLTLWFKVGLITKKELNTELQKYYDSQEGHKE